jgi:hypothetical protein
MKRILQTLVLVLFAQVVFGQCQASFTNQYDITSDTLYINDQSVIFDSTGSYTITGWTYTVNSGGLVVWTGTGQPSPTVYLPSLSGGSTICLSISTSNGCTSTFCDSVYHTYPVGPSCQAYFISYYDSITNQMHFSDASAVDVNSTIVGYDWTFSSGTPATDTTANPVVSFNTPGFYTVCLSITSSTGCTDSYCTSVYAGIIDSVNPNCYLTVVPYINNVSTIGGNDGFIDITVSGGYSPYAYHWDTGATTEDVYGLSSGIYTLLIDQANPACPTYSYSYSVSEPYDSIPLDTLYSPVIDTCLPFVADSFYVEFIYVDSLTATINWIFQGQGMTFTIPVTYTYNVYGPYVVVLTIDCNSFKNLATYMTYVNINESLGVDELAPAKATVYPNPVSQILNIDQVDGISEISVFNNLGQLVGSYKADGNAHMSLDASSWKSGMYMIRIHTAKGQTNSIVLKK